ncbi:hypothetical protein ACQP1W_38860 [Spirillospora sp. CA-255316]
MTRPQPDELFDADTYRDHWPMGVDRVELDDGHPIFYGSFTADDAQAAERAWPGRHATIEPWDRDGRGNLVLHAAGCAPGSCPLWK